VRVNNQYMSHNSQPSATSSTPSCLIWIFFFRMKLVSMEHEIYKLCDIWHLPPYLKANLALEVEPVVFCWLRYGCFQDESFSFKVHPTSRLCIFVLILCRVMQIFCWCRPKKLLHAVQDETYRQGMHELHETHKLADEVCRYDLDELDSAWLTNYNEHRLQFGKL